MTQSTNSSRYNRETQRIIFSFYEFKCVHCGHEFDFQELTRDHVIPNADGGTKAWVNIVPACFPCNNSRGCDRLSKEKEIKLLKKARKSFRDMLKIREIMSRERGRFYRERNLNEFNTRK